uniref:TSEN15 tRNA splicing endonuclease subunit n=1 Tax=Cyprinus carpio TaxID=7962 RepID=A0A8C2JVE1_CYPCA
MNSRDWTLEDSYRATHLMHLDVGDSAQVYAAFLVYMDLTEVRKWKEVVGVSCPELQAVLLEAREKEGEAAQMIFPLPSHRSIKHREYETFTLHLCSDWLKHSDRTEFFSVNR